MPPHSCHNHLLRYPCTLLVSLLHKHRLDRSPTQFTSLISPSPWTGRTSSSGTALWPCCSPSTGNLHLTSAEDPQKSAQAEDYPSGPLSFLPRTQSSLPACIKSTLFKFDFSMFLPSMPELPPLPMLCKKPEPDGHLLKENGSVVHFLLQDHTANLTHR